LGEGLDDVLPDPGEMHASGAGFGASADDALEILIEGDAKVLMLEPGLTKEH
jgi:hypothetical protein